MLERILEGVREAGAKTEKILLREHNVLPCRACERCRKDKRCTRLLDGMQEIYPKIIKAQGLILGSPVHNYNISASLKSFIDRLYCFYDFTTDRPRGWTSRLAGQGRKAMIFAVGEQKDVKAMGVALPAMHLPLEALGYEVTGELAAKGFFDLGAVSGDANLMAKALALGQRLARSL